MPAPGGNKKVINTAAPEVCGNGGYEQNGVGAADAIPLINASNI
jgi:hypothetical protein